MQTPGHMTMKTKVYLKTVALPACIFGFAALLTGSSGLFAQSQWSRDASRNNEVVTLNMSDQKKPVIVSDRKKGAIIVWEDDRNGSVDVYGQRMLESGNTDWTPNGAEIAGGAATQQAPAIAVTDTGSFFAAWLDDDNIVSDVHVLLQPFSTLDAGPVWLSPLVAHRGDNSPPRLILNNLGDIITATYLSAEFDDVISFQVTTGNGATRFFLEQKIANSNAKGRQPRRQPPVVSALNGGIIAAWTDARSDSTVYVTGIHSDAAGTEWDKGEQPLSESLAFATYPVIVPDGSEGAIIAWIQPVAGAEDDNVRVTRVDATGEQVWSVTVTDLPATVGRKANLEMTSDQRGGAYLVWENVSATNPKLYAQRIRNSGDAWSADVALSDGVGAQLNAAIISSFTGNLLCAWQDARNGEADILGQAVDSTGTLMWNPAGVDVSSAGGAQLNPAIAADGLGGAIIAWEDQRNATSDIYAQRVSVDGQLGEFRTAQIDAPTSVDDWEIGATRTISWKASPQIDSVKIELSRDGGQVFETLFDKLVNSGQTTSTAYTVSGNSSEQAVLRISAVEAPFVRGVSETFRISDPQGPTILHTPLAFANAAEATAVSASAVDASGVQSMVLHYKVGGEAGYHSSEMIEERTSSFSAAVPADSVTERGLQYYIEAIDSIGTRANSDTFAVAVRFAAGTQTKQVAIGSELTSYRMISTPNLLTQPLADSVFAASGFGVYDSTSWRLFEYRSNSNVERDSLNAASFRFQPGHAFWLISASTRTVDFGRGESVATNSGFTVILRPGWNQVANPFAFPVAWSDILAANPGVNISQQPWLFRGSYIVPEEIDPFEGYFIFNFSDTDVGLEIPAIEFTPRNQSLVKSQDGLQWQMQIQASCGEALDTQNFVGIDNNAALEWDPLDQPEPPVIGNFVSLYFPKKGDWRRYDFNYASDYRGSLDDGQTWKLEVRNNIRNSEVRVEFATETLPAGLKATLLDEKLKISQDLLADPVYRFPTGSAKSAKVLKLVIGKPDYVSQIVAESGLVPTEFELTQNFPNPFNPTTTIRYGLPADEKVTLRIYDVLGREIVRLVDGEAQKAGFHVASWNGRTRDGLPVASGLYVYRITAGKYSKARKMLLVK